MRGTRGSGEGEIEERGRKREEREETKRKMLNEVTTPEGESKIKN